jgi:hypothetical protein
MYPSVTAHLYKYRRTALVIQRLATVGLNEQANAVLATHRGAMSRQQILEGTVANFCKAPHMEVFNQK